MTEQPKETAKSFLGVNIPESLFVELKKRAADERRSLTDIVIDLIRKYLNS